MKKEDIGRDSAATQSPPAEGAVLTAVSALMEERRRYEEWITSLEARRQTTQAHVFTRVHADYTSRLEAVIVQLKSHTDGLRRETDSLSSRLSALRDDRQRAEDERAEAELRAHVGELSPGDWERTAAASDEKLAEYAARHDEVEQELKRTRELFEEAQRPVRSAAPEPSPEPRRSGKGAAEPDVARTTITTVTEASMPVRASRPAPDFHVIHQTPAPGMLPIEQHALDIQEHAPAPPPAAPSAPAAPAAAAPVASPASPAPAAPVAREAPPVRTAVGGPRKSSFDELAFLSSVVDTPSGSIEPAPTDQPDEKTRRDTFAIRSHEDAISNLTDSGSAPLVPPASDSLLSRSTRTDALTSKDALADGAKTLKCNECGAMNYPTEWYCERCGAELASL